MRCFVAVNLPEDERAAAYEAAAPLRRSDLPVRWVRADGLHVTLKFLGDVPEEREAEIAAALDAVVGRARPFAVTVGGVGTFPSSTRPRVVWLGVEQHPALELLANDVETALAPLGFASELRPFRPHVTLGRARQGARPSAFKTFETLATRVAYDGVAQVESVDLMESVLGPDGATYRVRHRSFLGGRR